MAVLLAVCYSSYSYSEVVNGTTGNAADIGYNWVMRNILPQQAGLEVTGVLYRYTAVKDPNSDMVVYVQNEDAQNQGQYIFREVDDWSQRPGKTITKVLPQPNVLIDRWGDGSIVVEGDGQVQDAVVAYDYRYDPCFDPQSSPECPGYVPEIPDIPEPDLTDLYDQEQMFVDEELEREVEVVDEDQKERDRAAVARRRREKEGLEVALGAVNSALMTAEAELKHTQLVALGDGIINPYSTVTIQGGVYEEPLVMEDKDLPDNKSARRVSMAQQFLHEKMVNSQYEKQK